MDASVPKDLLHGADPPPVVLKLVVFNATLDALRGARTLITNPAKPVIAMSACSSKRFYRRKCTYSSGRSIRMYCVSVVCDLICNNAATLNVASHDAKIEVHSRLNL